MAMAHGNFKGGRWGCVLGLTVASGSAFGQTPPPPESVRFLQEAETGRRFPLVRAFPGKPNLRLEALGVGHRLLFGVSYYAIAIYVDVAGLKKALGGRGTSQEVMAVLGAGQVSLSLDIQYTQGVSAKRRVEVIQERLSKIWKGPGSFETDPDAKKLKHFFAREARRGDESFLWFHPDGRLVLEEKGNTQVEIRSPQIRQFILETYFGPESVSRDLKQSLFSRLDGMLSPPGVP